MKKEAGSREQRGLTLVEVLVGTAIFLTVAVAAYGSFAGLFKIVNLAQYQELAINVANEQMEIIRNMPYQDVGVVGSLLNGNVPHIQTITRGGVQFNVEAIIRGIDLPADGVAGGTPNDTNPLDNKLVSLTVSCAACGNTQPLTITGQVAPLALENTGNTGSIFVHVHDSSGKPIQGANVAVTNTQTSQTTNDVTDDTGTLALVGVPPGANAYHIVVTKTGYSSDQTYPGGNNPDTNVVTGQVSETYFFIDKVSSFVIASVSPTCQPVPNYDFHLTSSKETAPGVPKYSQNKQTDGSGQLTLSSLEWDTAGYTLTPTDAAYDLSGSNPMSPIALNPGATVNLQLVAVPHDQSALMISVIDDTTKQPISGAAVRLYGNGYDETETTGQGFISQEDWSGGGGQESYVDKSKYEDGQNVDASSPGHLRLINDGFTGYDPSGWLQSSTFDMGTTSNFNIIRWLPVSQLSASTSIKLKFETAADPPPTGSWAFNGPEYTVSNSSLSATPNRYARYEVLASTSDPAYTPDLTNVGFFYTSDCLPPGQVLFQGLSFGDSYNIDITVAGYTPVAGDLVNIDDPQWKQKDERLSPI